MARTDRAYVINHMHDERDKVIARLMKSEAKISCIASLIRAIERMKRHGGVLIRDGQDFHESPPNLPCGAGHFPLLVMIVGVAIPHVHFPTISRPFGKVE